MAASLMSLASCQPRKSVALCVRKIPSISPFYPLFFCSSSCLSSSAAAAAATSLLAEKYNPINIVSSLLLSASKPRRPRRGAHVGRASEKRETERATNWRTDLHNTISFEFCRQPQKHAGQFSKATQQERTGKIFHYFQTSSQRSGVIVLCTKKRANHHRHYFVASRDPPMDHCARRLPLCERDHTMAAAAQSGWMPLVHHHSHKELQQNSYTH